MPRSQWTAGPKAGISMDFRPLSTAARAPARCLAALLLVAMAACAHAQSCDLHPPQVDFAREDLHRAATEGDLPTAQDFADRARREFDHLAGLTGRCGCPSAASKLEEAATQARQAQRVDSRQDLRRIVGLARTSFETAVAQLRECGKH